ncbi:hypothetical protein [Paenibacillus sp. 1P03SA]|uniref:hypothetical protein n=1 Tax=Paenibacillus sp. 1P03SA TaxID=3132294 RepID=UPI0039A235C4
MRSSSSLLEELAGLYKFLLESPSFERYEQIEEQIDQLYLDLSEKKSFTAADKLALEQIQNMHKKVTAVILQEQKEIKNQINTMEMKKNVSNAYSTKASYTNDAFFVDIRN